MKKRIFIILAIMLIGIFTIGCEKEDTKYDYLVLVNKYSKLPDDWESNIELVDTKNAWDEDIKVEKKAFEKYQELKKALEKEGITIELDSVYRSVKDQQDLWDRWSQDPEKGIEYVKKYVATPGYSEHHTGLAIDICIRKDGKLIDDNEDMINEKEIFQKIHEKLADYGFILRYLNGREDSTGYTYEPWHLRYINDTTIAKEIMNKNLTFEEYLESISDLKNNHEACKYKIETTLLDYFNDIYKDKITNARFNIKKIYTDEEAKKIETLNIGEKDIVFEVVYELMPKDKKYVDELTVANGEYNETLGWVTGISRVGVLKYENGKYQITNFGTGF